MGSKLLNPSKWPSSWRLTQEAKSLAAACRAVVSGGRIWVVQVEGCWRRTYTGSYEMRRSVMESQENIKLKQQEPKTWPKVAIIVLNWNGWQDTIECLESLQRITYPNYQIIVVDNGSTDDSVDKIKAWAKDKFGMPSITSHSLHIENFPSINAFILLEDPSIIMLTVRQNLGFSEGNNLGIAYALSTTDASDFVFLLNNDAQPEPTCITECVEVAQKKDAAIVGALVKRESNKLLFA